MPQSSDLEMTHEEVERVEKVSPITASPEPELRAAAIRLAHKLAWLPSVRSSTVMSDRCKTIRRTLVPALGRFRPPIGEKLVSDDFRWLHDNVSMIEMELHSLRETLKTFRNIPYAHTEGGETVPRAVAIAAGFLLAVDYKFSEQAFSSYIEAFQQVTLLNLKELVALISGLKVILLEEIAGRAHNVLSKPEGVYKVAVCITSLRETIQAPWKEVLEPLVLFDQVLRQDPEGSYPRMDFESRELYRKKVAKFARRSDCTEMEVASEALALARDAQSRKYEDPRLARRQSHVGFYLLAEGREILSERIGFSPAPGYRIQSFLRKHPNEFYLPAIEILTFGIMSAIVLLLTDPSSSPALILLAMLALLLPSSQSAIQVVNYLMTSLLRPQILPKLDFSEGIPEDCFTLVAVPTLLLSEQQVHRLVGDLEVRFLGNQDRNLAFALLSDLPDSRELPDENNPLIDLCADLLRGLNRKYAAQGGSFLLLHRHRVYNPREKVWMGWERKRGKLVDLNKLLRNEYDSFPVKAGDLTVLARTRFVITLDSDTELPRDSADRMIGALAHPLNQAIVDPEKNVVAAGYGILQPRVGVSVQSAARSRLAAVYSGETGFDIYTRAVSDVYQDLYGEATFAGKGIFEAEIVHRVLDRRFPRNALLSHDLIEGAYARVGLLSDVEVIEDYPSHYRAYNRRKHRWLRGDWQIANWLASRVPDESGRYVPNQISILSQWKILDNLRRSLVEPATLLLLVLGWVVLPGKPVYWTLATIAILFVPAWCRLIFELVRAVVNGKAAIVHEAFEALLTANINVGLMLTFLPHQMLVSLDAVVRTLVRRMLTRQRLLQWETAAEAELGGRSRTPLDVYLDLTPIVAVGLGALVWFTRRSGFAPAAPILLLWAGSKLISSWLNRPPRASHKELSGKDRRFLRANALHIWRYFAEFSNEEHHWLIPDNVQEEPLVVAPRLSPTNLGLLLNARQAACEFGYLTLPEFAEQTRRTLDTMASLERYRGHLLNWYDTRTLAPLPPRFVSSVDNGNLLTSLWTLRQGSLDCLERPLLPLSLSDGLLDYLYLLRELRGVPRRRLRTMERTLARKDWLTELLSSPESLPETFRAKSKRSADIAWFLDQARGRLRSITQLVRLYTPWLLPEFADLREQISLTPESVERISLRQLPEFIGALIAILESKAPGTNGNGKPNPAKGELVVLLLEARANALRLITDLQEIARTAGQLADEMDFAFLLHPRRKLLSIGFDVEAQQLSAACYDLLASEARIAVFAAIAKDDIAQETWFKLGRIHTVDHGRQVLLSWTATMFEYLMPSIWMRSYSGTLLERTRVAAVNAQQAYVASRRIPWGISESACAKRDDAGNYQYHAFGIPHLALKEREFEALVISPYSTFLALHVDPAAALRNLRRLQQLGWGSGFGYYEAADFTGPHRIWRKNHTLVRCWMAHHQGMSLLSIANVLCEEVFQRWFHSDARVQATELLLHEKPVAHLRPVRAGYGVDAA